MKKSDTTKQQSAKAQAVPVLVNKFTYDHKARTYEINALPSETIAGEAYTIKEMLERARQGIAPIQKLTYYSNPEKFEEFDFDTNHIQDLTEYDQMTDRLKELQSEYEEEQLILQEQEEIKKQAEEQESIIEKTDTKDEK